MALNYLVKLLEAKKQTHTSLIIEALARCKCPNLADIFTGLVAKKSRGAQHVDWELHQLLESVRYLPVSDLPKLDAFAATLSDKLVDKYLAALEPLRLQGQAQPT
jgi:hypothetical protein